MNGNTTLAEQGKSQRAMVAGKLADMPRGGDRSRQSANLHSASDTAELLNVSERSVKTAKKVQREAVPELSEKVEQGSVSVSAAADAVCQLLGCSTRWARTLTQEAREAAKAERNEKIIELAEQGKSQREIAAEVGVDQKTVANRMAEEKRNSSEIPQTEGNAALDTDTSPDIAELERQEIKAAAKSVSVVRGTQGTGDNEWYTPQKYIDAASSRSRSSSVMARFRQGLIVCVDILDFR